MAIPKQPLYLLMNSSSILLARALMQSPPDAPNIQLQIVEGKADDVVQAEVVQVVPVSDQGDAHLGRVILRRGNRIVLDPIRKLGLEARQNLRVPVDFESYAYPESGGRTLIKADNLSSGGIAFYSSYHFAPHERYEVVIPITSEPLLVWCETLRGKPHMGPITLYAAQFIDLIHDVEAKIREAVFSAQIFQKASMSAMRRK